jgi:hypothetical protein
MTETETFHYQFDYRTEIFYQFNVYYYFTSYRGMEIRAKEITSHCPGRVSIHEKEGKDFTDNKDFW